MGAEIEERDYAKVPLQRAEVRAIVERAGGVAAVLNTRHAEAKANDWKTAPPDPETFVDAVLREPNLLRRPILVGDAGLVVGKDEPAIRALLAK